MLSELLKSGHKQSSYLNDFLFRDTCISSNLILLLLSYFPFKTASVINEPHCHKSNRHRFDKKISQVTMI